MILIRIIGGGSGFNNNNDCCYTGNNTYYENRETHVTKCKIQGLIWQRFGSKCSDDIGRSRTSPWGKYNNNNHNSNDNIV